MGEIALQQFLEPGGFELPSHAGCGVRDDGVGDLGIARQRRLVRNGRQHFGAGLAADLDEKFVPVPLDDLGQRQVEAGVDLWPGAHRNAKAGAARNRAIHGDDEGVLPPQPIGLVDIGPLKENAILDSDGVQFAGADADEGELFGWRRRRNDLHAGVGALGAPQRFAGGWRYCFHDCGPTA